jgi:hypothetical protein
LDAVYVVAVLVALGMATWLFVDRIVRPGTESLQVQLDPDRKLEMLSPEWLGIGLVIPLLWLVRKWSLSDLPWLQQLLNVTLRSLLILALCLAATRVVMTDFDARITTVFVVDVSESVPESFLEQAQADVQETYARRGRNAVRHLCSRGSGDPDPARRRCGSADPPPRGGGRRSGEQPR